MTTRTCDEFTRTRIRQEEIDKYLPDGGDFINEDAIAAALHAQRAPEAARVREILAKARTISTLSLEETAALLQVTDPELIAEMETAAWEIKHQVYDNRIVTFAPLYMGTKCVNNCLYCGFRRANTEMLRGVLTPDEVRRETEVLAGEIGHKRLIVVYGEHPDSDTEYIADTLRACYGVKVKTRHGYGQIRRANVNAAPLPVEDLRFLHEVGIGTYQVFQETYHHATYDRVHPRGTLKNNYAWRLTCMHRAMEAGVDDVGIGVLFGLADWRFEVLALLAHTHELERAFGVGPHTISFPRLEPAQNSPLAREGIAGVSDEDLGRVITVLRLAVPYTGLILTAREPAHLRRRWMRLGITQIDAASQIGLGAYGAHLQSQEEHRQQFHLSDTRSLDEVVRALAEEGMITSFCTAGYRCGRTGKCIMDLLRTGQEGHFCKLNAVLTFREWLDDFASAETRQIGLALIEREMAEVRDRLPAMYGPLARQYERIAAGDRDLYF